MGELAQITRAGPRGMITLRGDLNAPEMARAVKAASGQSMPSAGQILGDGARGVAWMSPDEILLMVEYDKVLRTLAQIKESLAGSHALAVDVSDARAVFQVIGADAREVLARLCPVDLHADHFETGQFRRTRMAQIAVAFWCHDTGFDVICFRSVAHYGEGILRNAAGGARVGALGEVRPD